MSDAKPRLPRASIVVDAPQYALRMPAGGSRPGQREKQLLLLDKQRLQGGHYDDEALAAFDEIRTTHLHDAVALRRSARALQTEYEVQAVLGFSEASVLPCAILAESLGQRGIGVDVALRCRNKALMAAALTSAGVACPASFVAGNDTDLEREVRCIGGYPVICKPLMGFASFGVIKAGDYAELLVALRRIRRSTRFLMGSYHALDAGWSDDQVLVQRFVPGDEVAIDGYVHRGEVTDLAIIDKPGVSQGPFFPDAMHILPSRLPDETQAKVRRAVAACVAAMGLDNSVFHIEARLFEGEVFIIEVAARVAFVRSVQRATGVDTMQVLMALRRGERPAAEVSSGAYVGSLCVTAAHSGIFRGFANLDLVRSDPCVEEVLLHARPGSRVAAPPESAGDIAHIRVSAASYDAVADALIRARETLQVHID